jgi:multiple sugar transport system substrate-binding protein
MNRTRLITLTLALLLPVLAACGGGTTQTSPTSAPATGGEAATTAPAAEAPTAAPAGEATSVPATGNEAPTTAPAAGGQAGGEMAVMEVEDGAILRVTSWGDSSEQAINTESFARFNELYPNVTIQYQPQASDYQTKLKADAAGGTLADVFYLDSGLMQSFAPEELLLDLTPSLQEAGVSLENYPSSLLELFQLDGTTYGLPKDFNPLVLFVNNEMAATAGVDPASITSWDAWRDATEKMTVGEGNAKVYGMCTIADAQRFGALILQQGIPIVDGTTANFTDPKAVEAVNFWYGMYADDLAQLPKEMGSDWCGQAFGEGKAAMTLEGGWMVPYLAKDFPDATYTVLPLPTPPSGDRSSLLFTNAWAASASTQYPKAAAALVMYLTSPDNQKPILDVGFALPTNNSILEDPNATSSATTKVLLDAAAYGTVADIAFSREHKDDVIKALNNNIEAAFLGQADVESALETAKLEAEDFLSQ